MKTATNQIMGGVVWGIGMALHEETQIDHTFGRIMNANIAEYHVPVNADVGEIKIISSASRGSEKSASSAWPPRSPTRSTMPPVSASAICPSASISCNADEASTGPEEVELRPMCATAHEAQDIDMNHELVTPLP